MDGHVIDVRDGGQGFQQRRIVLAAHQAFVAGGDQMVRVDFLDQAGGFREPADESFPDGRVVGETARLIADLPGENGGILAVRLSRHGIGTADDGFQVVEEQFLGLLIHRELRHLLHERPITVQEGNQGLSGAGPFQVLPVAPGPLPGVVQIQDSLHVPLPEFYQKTVQSC